MSEAVPEKPVVEKPVVDEQEPDRSPSESEADEGSAVNEVALLRKLDRRLLPAVGILYLLSFLDRSNGISGRLIALPEIMGLQ